MEIRRMPRELQLVLPSITNGDIQGSNPQLNCNYRIIKKKITMNNIEGLVLFVFPLFLVEDVKLIVMQET